MTASANTGTLLVTGATGGVGAEIVRHAARDGFQVIAVGRDESRLEALLAGLDAKQPVHPAVADVTDWRKLSEAIASAIALSGGLDVAVANAGTMTVGDFESGDPESWRDMVLTNVLGVAHTIKATYDRIVSARGRFVLMGSAIGHRHLAGSFYSATKFAVAAIAENLRLQLVGTGARATLVEPGKVDTPIWPVRPEPSLNAADLARTVMWAIRQPPHIDLNQVLVRPTGQPL
jgi:NADP-dependent 3-hydroxy acid dehydrogenase YdfG